MNKDMRMVPIYPSKTIWPEWNGWSDFFDKFNGNAFQFEQAREFAHSLGFGGQKEWLRYSKSGKRPSYIPARPDRYYEGKGWIDWGDWLGTNNISTRNIKYPSYFEARLIAHSLGLKSVKEWRHLCLSGKRPSELPASPSQHYEGKGWIDWGDFLGTSNRYKKNFLSFEEARSFVRSKKFKKRSDWKWFIKSKDFPSNLPTAPHHKYKDEGWAGMGDFLGLEGKIYSDYPRLSFENAKDAIRYLSIPNSDEFRRLHREGIIPKGIAYNPNQSYKKVGWSGWEDFLGKDGSRHSDVKKYLYKKREARDWKDALIFARSLNLKTRDQWREFCKAGKRPKDIPSNPQIHYNEHWMGWRHFLGSESA